MCASLVNRKAVFGCLVCSQQPQGVDAEFRVAKEFVGHISDSKVFLVTFAILADSHQIDNSIGVAKRLPINPRRAGML